MYTFQLFNDTNELLEEKVFRNRKQYIFYLPKIQRDINKKQSCDADFKVVVTAVSYFSVKTTLSNIFSNCLDSSL
jgi:hypothetical protein